LYPTLVRHPCLHLASYLRGRRLSIPSIYLLGRCVQRIRIEAEKHPRKRPLCRVFLRRGRGEDSQPWSKASFPPFIFQVACLRLLVPATSALAPAKSAPRTALSFRPCLTRSTVPCGRIFQGLSCSVGIRMMLGLWIASRSPTPAEELLKPASALASLGVSLEHAFDSAQSSQAYLAPSQVPQLLPTLAVGMIRKPPP